MIRITKPEAVPEKDLTTFFLRFPYRDIRCGTLDRLDRRRACAYANFVALHSDGTGYCFPVHFDGGCTNVRNVC